jgi:hypothetical protein
VRPLACLTALVLLAGCNMVITRQPMFAAGAAGAPTARPGVWRMQMDDKCKVDEAQPLSQWPNCGGGVVMGPNSVSYYDHDGDAPVWKTDPFVLAAGQPMLAQAKISVSGGVKVDGDLYGYGGVRSLKSDDAGRLTQFEFWPVQCGPPNPAPDKFFTEHPAEGVKVEPMTSDSAFAKALGPLCTIDDPAVMRRVAAESEAWVPRKGQAHWVRDPIPGDLPAAKP